MINPGVLERLPDTARTEAKEELDARIAAAFAEDAKSVDVSRLLPEVEEATTAADAAAGEARARALDPLLSPDEVKLARREMESKRRSNNPSLKRPDFPVAPEQKSGSR